MLLRNRKRPCASGGESGSTEVQLANRADSGTSVAVPLIAAAIFLGAFLLFAVEPLIGRFVLPWFGGTPAVWTTCMLFFQLMLLAGYAYAMFSVRYLSARAQPVVHVALLLAALAFLPVVPATSWKPSPEQNPT